MSDGIKKAQQAYEDLYGTDKGSLVEQVTPVVIRAWESPFSTKSDFAREFAPEVAAAACLGYISTSEKFAEGAIAPDPESLDFGTLWKITLAGAQLLTAKVPAR